MSALGRPRLHLRRTDSTNDRARELAIAGAPHGTLVTAGEQTAGRGRQGRRWSAPPDSSLLMSLLLRGSGGDEAGEPGWPALLPLLAGVAVCDVAGSEARVKWPNDVVLVRPDGSFAKLAGILTEGRPQQGWAILGIGLNVAVKLDELPAELRPHAASLELERHQIEPTLEQLLKTLARRLSEPPEETLEQLRTRDALRGREISWAGGQGQAEGIDETGGLVVELSNGRRTSLVAGEVHLQRAG